MIMNLLLVSLALALCVFAPDVDAACKVGCLYCGDDSCGSCISYSGFYKDSSAETCPKCIANCRSCLSSETNKCRHNMCDTGFYLSEDRTQCIALPKGCASYDDSSGTNGACTQCKYTGEAITADNQTCEACADNCDICVNNGPGKCDKCTSGYGRTSNKLCEACAEYCMYCHLAGATKCDKCWGGYELSGGACKKRACKHNCLCDKADETRCDMCDIGYGPTEDGRGCLPCSKHCAVCQIPASCKNGACHKGYRMDGQGIYCMNAASVTRGSYLITLIFLFSIFRNS